MKLTFLFVLIFFINGYSQFESLRDSKLSKLLESSTINVTIGGSFLVTGTFPALVTERADAFVTRIFNEARETLLRTAVDPESRRRVHNEIENYTLRGIKLKRANGEELIIDLEKFRINGDLKNNPYLKNDDVLIFPIPDLTRSFFRIDGAVNKPGQFYYMEGDRLFDAIELAGGLNPAYENVTQVEISRLSYDGYIIQRERYSINENIQLKRGDFIRVLADETQRKGFSVLVLGDVLNPGYIPITKNNTTLREVIDKAGGVRESASLRRAKLYTGTSVSMLLEMIYGIRLKEFPDQLEMELTETLSQFESRLMYRMSNVNEEDSSYFFMENQLRVFLQSGPIDLSDLSEDGSESSNYIVRNGDVVIIPQKVNSVFVFGQVKKSGHINYIPGANFEYYIDKAGGLGDYADEDVMVIKAATREWIDAKNQEVLIEEGDYIFAPRVPSRSFHYYVKLAGEYLGIVGSIATIILLLVQLSK